MTQLVKKEIEQFFSSLTGYLIIGIFMLVTGLFLWVIPGNWNIPASGYASLNGLFELAPWLFLILIPGVTMGVFSEEIKSGTIELLLSRPLTRWQIVLAKYLASYAIIVIAIALTGIYYFSVSQMAVPTGNIDHGAVLGSYIALLFLGAVYTAIGIFCSALNSNQAISFLASLALCFLVFSGVDLLASIPFFKNIALPLQSIGIEHHYASFSKGLLSLKDVVYFISVVVLFLSFTHQRIKNIR